MMFVEEVQRNRALETTPRFLYSSERVATWKMKSRYS
jgi:hypothetical protein